MCYNFLKDYIALVASVKGLIWRVRQLGWHLTGGPTSLVV
jgi:hypothetical protein